MSCSSFIFRHVYICVWRRWGMCVHVCAFCCKIKSILIDNIAAGRMVVRERVWVSERVKGVCVNMCGAWMCEWGTVRVCKNLKGRQTRLFWMGSLCHCCRHSPGCRAGSKIPCHLEGESGLDYELSITTPNLALDTVQDPADTPPKRSNNWKKKLKIRKRA